ncbi:sensor histidine kinase [Anatilimnocola floriformis]|uniref:sensor histidine kinase n=1 Tax=Anatilimnocola floriformis TaxID=2948575 RepID=UPI0020C5020C|nr:ATP-binding protein [Anatilimnocola floriformis]
MTQLTSQNRLNLLSVYMTDLELEVDRLRKQLQQICLEGAEICSGETTAGAADNSRERLRTLIEDIREEVQSPLALDRTAPIMLRKLIESVFRWQQRLENRPQASLSLTLSCENVNWFPVRLRHILQNLIANALRYGDPEKGESRVNVEFKSIPGGHQLRISDNGLGMPDSQWTQLLEPMYRASAKHSPKLGVGLAIVKHLVEQSGGEVTVDSGEGMGSCFVITLPAFDKGDFLE